MAENMNASTEHPVELVTVDRPEAGETLTVLTASGLQIVLAFNPADARFGVEGDDFILSLEDGARIEFQGLVTAVQGTDAPTIQIGGIEIDAGVLVEQALAFGAEQAQAEPIETAAGEEGEGAEAAGGGGSRYDDSFGDLISGLAKQGIIGETELDFGLIADGNIELPADAQDESEGDPSNGGGFAPLGVGTPSATPAPNSAPSAPSAPDTDGDDGDDSDGGLEPLNVGGMDIITNEASGNLQIPDELILYLADPDRYLADPVLALGDPVADLSVSGPSYDGVTDNAHIWSVPGVALADADSFNTWADDGNGHVRFHIGGVGPLYQGGFTYQVADGADATGQATIGVQNVATGKDGSYWILDRTGDGSDEGEVLLGLDGRNKITGGDGDDTIHGGHDSSGDILIGGDGDDVIFGGSGKDDLQGGDGDDNFIMGAGFGRDDVDGGEEFDTITLVGVLTQGDVDDLSSWLTLDSGGSGSITAEGVISLGADASGTIDLGGGNEITFQNIEQIVYLDLV